MQKLAIALLLLAVTALPRQEQKTVETNPNNGRIDYIEFPATDIAKTKAFYQQVFGWKFTDYGPDYTSFEDGRLAGGFTTEGKVAQTGPLAVAARQPRVQSGRPLRRYPISLWRQ